MEWSFRCDLNAKQQMDWWPKNDPYVYTCQGKQSNCGDPQFYPNQL